MEIDFQVGNVVAKLQRGWFLGGMRLTTPHQQIWLQHPLNPLTQFSLRLKQSWRCQVEGQSVVVEKIRPLWAAGARTQAYKVFVGGQLVAEANGY